MTANIRIVLVETTHPGNIGAVARAMKNMGLTELYLVAPKQFPCADATARASGADDLLSQAVVCKTLTEAISGCQMVVGASARSRSISWPETDPRACAEQLRSASGKTRAAILFGREHSGLTNAEMDACHLLLKIPCNPNFSSLNVAAAVQIVAYELFLTGQQARAVETQDLTPSLASAEQLESFYQHLYQTLLDVGFIHPAKSRSIMRRLRRLFNRTRLETREIDLLRGVFSAAQGKKSIKRDVTQKTKQGN